MGRQLRVQLLPTWHTYTRHVENCCIIPVSNSKDEKAYIQVKTLFTSMYWYGINVAILATRLWVPHSQMIHFHERTSFRHRRHRQKHNSRYKSLEAAGASSCPAGGLWGSPWEESHIAFLKIPQTSAKLKCEGIAIWHWGRLRLYIHSKSHGI